MSEITDHDLLIQLHENITLNFAQVKADIKDLKDGTSNQLMDHEGRIRSVEAFKWKLVGINAAISGGIAIAALVIAFFSR